MSVENPFFLRITAAPNCNLRCNYCNPNGEFNTEKMSDFELLATIKAAYELGIRTVHYTGGEPTVRKGFVNLVAETKKIGMETIDVTTNGVLFDGMAEKLKEAGLTGASISLDSLKREKVYTITHSDVLEPVYSSIVKSCSLFQNVVVNMVVLHENFDEIPDFIEFARQMNGHFIPRFCELQNYGPAYGDNQEQFAHDLVSREEIIATLKQLGALEVRNRKEVDKYNGHAEYFNMNPDNLVVGVIAPYSHNWSCSGPNCGRIRIGPTGAIKSCVSSPTYQINLPTTLRSGYSGYFKLRLP